VALDALRGSAPIHANRLASGFPLVLVALGAVDVAMHAVQHESCLVVIEVLPVPLHRDMTLQTIFLGPALELPGVSVFRVVASRALGWGFRELRRHLGHAAGIRSGRPVALDAFHVPMGPLDLEFPCGVFEWARFFPLLGGVAGLTGHFGLVRIGVTCVADPGNEVILAWHSGRSAIRDRRRQLRGAGGGERFVALLAGYRGVEPGEGELRLRVARDGKSGGQVARGCMAPVALVRMGRGGELPAVAVGMAGGADELAGNVHRAAALGLMAFRATERGVFSFEGKRAFAVRLAVKAGGFEACHVVTGCAVRSGRAPGELPFVRIFMALLAPLVLDGAPEIGALVAFGARYCRVLSRERKLRGGVIELSAGAIVLPAIGIVAVVAGAWKLDLLKGAAMGVGMATLAAAESQPFELGSLLAGPGSVALLAGLRLMQSRKREMRGGMIEPGSRLEAILSVAAEAIDTELALMLVLMTESALAAKTKERSVQVLQFDLQAGGK
jgi:hypothetical protein